jgi:UDP-N-acetylmuramoyl-tripeptide--D-alanyl-D-alanine ligase
MEKFDTSRCFSFTDKTALIEHLKPKLDKQTIVLVKASRGMRLEEIVEGIKL